MSANGPPVRLAPETALALAMAMHELATNAAKHGALSVPAGRVAVDWRVEPPAGRRHGAADGTLLLEWSEHGGPPVSGPPTRRGFGSRLIERGLPVQLGRGGAVSLEFAPQGLRCRIRAPLRPGVVVPASLISAIPDAAWAARDIGGDGPRPRPWDDRVQVARSLAFRGTPRVLWSLEAVFTTTVGCDVTERPMMPIPMSGRQT